MKTKRIITLSLLMIAVLSLLVSCSGSSSTQTVEKSWYWDHELTGPDSKIATENHTVVLQMDPSTKSGKETVLSSKTIPITYKRTGIFKYCIDERDPLFVSFTVTDATGKVVASVKEGACVEAKITAGPHNVTVEYNQNKVGNAPKIAFIRPIQPTTKAKNKSISSGGFDINSAGKLAILDPKGDLLTISQNYPWGTPAKDNYYLITVPIRTVTPTDLLWFQIEYDSRSGNYLMSSKGAFGGYPPVSYDGIRRQEIGDMIFVPGGDCMLQLIGNYDMQTPLYTYSTDYKGTPPINRVSVDDINYTGWKFNMFLFWFGSDGLYIPSYIGISNHAACTSSINGGGKYNTIFYVWFRYYEDGTKMPSLQTGEIALFEKAMYQGRAWVFNADISDFSLIQDLKGIKSIKTSALSSTEIAIYSQPKYSGDMYITTSTLDDISKTGLTAGVGSLKILSTQEAITVLLSSKSCKYCILDGFFFNINQLSNIDLSHSSLKNSTFSNIQISNVNFSYADLSGSKFNYQDTAGSQLIISKSDFTGAKLDKSVFEAQILRYYTTARYIEIKDSTMNNASMRGVKLAGVAFRNTSLVNTDMSSLYNVSSDDINRRCQVNSYDDPNRTYIAGGKFDQATLNYLSNEDGKRLILKGADVTANTINGELGYSFVELFQPSTGGMPSNSRFFDLENVLFIGTRVNLSDTNNPGDLSNANFKNALFTSSLSLENVQKSCDDMTNLTGCADFSGATITSFFVKNSALKGVNFQDAKLSATDLSSTSKCNWAGQSANFTDSDLSGANLKKVIARNVNFTRVSMTNTDLSDGDFQRAVFKGSNVTYSNLQRANLCYATFNKDDLQQRASDLTGSYLQNVNLAYSDLTGSTMKQISLHSSTTSTICKPEQTCTDPNNPATCLCKPTNCASVYKANMSQVNLADSYLAGLDMSNAVLNSATMTGVFALGTNFTNADLSGQVGGLTTNLGYSFLFGANFTNSKVQNTSFLNAYVDNPVTPPTQKGTAVSYLSTLYTGFRGSAFIGKPVCPQYSTAGLTVLPTNTDSTMTCPDGSRGPCSGSQWIARMAIDHSKIIVTYGGSTFPAPAGCTGGAYLFW